MESKKIEHPKVFISYAWSGKEYEQNVLTFASMLKGDGVEVILDKWNMRPGADTIDFMEKCVKDPTVNYVLMLLDKNYSEKADGRKGGVGVETQIISAEVYKDVSQDKFIPIIFDRDENGNYFVPIYLNSRYHFDMTQDNRDEEYVKLVKTLYGRPMYQEPELGTMPAWVDEENESKSSLRFNIAMDKNEVKSLEALFKEIDAFNDEILSGTEQEKIDQILRYYKSFVPFRDLLIDIMLNSVNNENFIDNLCDFYERIKNLRGSGLKTEILSDFVHETFIYLIGILFKNKKYKEINILLTKTYFQNGMGLIAPTNFIQYFYCGSYKNVSLAKCKKDDKQYYSGLADLWIENLNLKALNKEEFVFADVLLYNLSILLLEGNDWYWFPKSYCYQQEFESQISLFSNKLKSKYELSKKKDLFSNWSIDMLKNKFNTMKKLKDEDKRYRYPENFEWANLILDYIKIDDIGSLN